MPLFFRQILSMGTRFDMVIPDIDHELGDQLAQLMTIELKRIEEKLSIYLPGSDITRINRNAFLEDVPIDEEMQGILVEISEYHALTGGYFDVSVKPVLDYLRRSGGERVGFPDSLRDLTGMDKVILKAGSIRFRKEGMALDLGGYGKGYAIRRLEEILKANKIENALLSFGESLVTGIGSHPYGDAWRISIPGEGSDTTGRVIFDLRNDSVSTSGNSLNNQGRFGSSGHIFDPVTFGMKTHLGLVSVKASDPVTAEVYSTALFGAGREKENIVCKERNDLEVCWIM